MAPFRSSLSYRLGAITRYRESLQRFTEDPDIRDRAKKFALYGGPPLLIALTLILYFTLRATPKPDYFGDPLDNVFNYTLLTNDFNNLPVEERAELIGQLVQRMQSMTAQDSALVAAFAAGIAGEAREQLQENVSRFALDMWDKYAAEYDDVSPEDRAAFVEDITIRMTRLMGSMVDWGSSDKSDEELLEQARRDAERDYKMLQTPGRRPSGSQLGTVYTIMRTDVGQHATPHQRARITLLMRDMMRHFRGQDLATGRPK